MRGLLSISYATCRNRNESCLTKWCLERFVISHFTGCEHLKKLRTKNGIFYKRDETFIIEVASVSSSQIESCDAAVHSSLKFSFDFHGYCGRVNRERISKIQNYSLQSPFSRFS